MRLTPEQRHALVAMAKAGQIDEVIDTCVAWLHDDLAGTLLERGGFATLQLNPDPHRLPRMQFVSPTQTQPVNAAKINGVLLVRD